MTTEEKKELSAEEAKKAKEAKEEKKQELSDDDLDKVAGGAKKTKF